MKQATTDHVEATESSGNGRNDLRTRGSSRDLIVRRDEFDDGQMEGAAEPAGMDVGSVMNSLRRNWMLGTLLGVLFVVPCAAIPWYLVKLEFKASGLVRISPQHVPLLFQTADQSNGSGRVDFKGFKNTQKQLILAPNLLNSALKKEGVSDLPEIRGASDPIAWLQDELKIKFPDESEIMEISMELVDGKSAKRIVDAIVATYYEDVVMAEVDERMKRASSLERVYADAENKARQKRAELQNAVDLLGTGDSSALNLAQQAAMQQYSLLRTELTKVQFDLMRIEGETQVRSQPRHKGTSESGANGFNEDRNTSVSGGANQPPGQGSPSATNIESQPDFLADPNTGEGANGELLFDFKLSMAISEDSVASQALRDVERLTAMINQTQKRLVPGARAANVDKYRQQLDDAKKKLAERTQLIREMLLVSGEGRGRFSGQVTDLPREKELLKEQERRLQDELKRQEAEAKKYGKSSIEVEMLQTEVASLDKVVERVGEELERTKIELKSTSRITLLGAAQIPQAGSSKIRLPLTAAAGLFGLFGPLALLTAVDVYRRYVNGRKSVQDLMLMPVLGSMPLVPKQIIHTIHNPVTDQSHVWHKRLGESVANITSMLLHRLEYDGHRVVMVTSAMPSEGKSTLSKQLAYSIANSGRSTLLIDMDLRRPVIHRRLNLPAEPGVSDVLRQGADLDSAVHQADDCPHLKVLTAGKYHGTLLKDSENGRLRDLFEEARSKYDIVIVDTSPLLPVMDGRLIGQYADGAVLSVIKDVSRLPNLAEAYHIMTDYNVPVYGCVVTGDRNDAYYYDYY